MPLFQVSNPAPFDPIGLFTYLRTYSRRLVEDDPKSEIETWQQTLERVVVACNSQLKCGFTNEEQQELFTLLYNLKCSVAGRFLWQLGTKTVDKLGIPSLQNCSFCVIDEPVKPFTWTMNMLMLGCGVGFRILPSDIDKLPKVKYALNNRKDTHDADFIVPDSREGWVKLLGRVLKSHFYSGHTSDYSCVLLRSKGAPIKSFGGLASGPDVLCDGLQKIDEILNKRAGMKLRPVDALDVMNIIGMIVVSGNVRRSALIALGDCNDNEYVFAKRWDLGNIPNYRAYSNNTVICNNIEDILRNNDFWEGYKGNGEPYGLMNLDLCRKMGRIGDIQHSDENVDGMNPCGEITLNRWETCCLAENYLPNIKSKEELYKCLEFTYRICKHSLNLPFEQSKDTEKIVHKNMRIGLGMTGYMQATEEQKCWLSDAYKHIRAYDIEYSRKNNFPVSIKLTTVKPSGTLSLLGNCTPGVHPGFAQYYIRRVRVASESPLIKIAKDHGFHVEYVQNFDGTNDYNTQIVSFPHKLPNGTILAENLTAVQQLEYVKRLQTEWSDNAVSVTVYYRKEELEGIKQWLRENYNENVKSVSFLLHTTHNFLQAPMECITKEKYEEMCKNITPMFDIGKMSNMDDNLENECQSGACPIR